MKCIYIAHQLGSGEGREANRFAAAKIVYWAWKTFHIAPIADWIILAGAQDTPEGRTFGLKTDLELVKRADGLWLMGPVVSPGMEMEAAEAARLGKPVYDFTGMTEEQIVRTAAEIGFPSYEGF